MCRKTQSTIASVLICWAGISAAPVLAQEATPATEPLDEAATGSGAAAAPVPNPSAPIAAEPTQPAPPLAQAPAARKRALGTAGLDTQSTMIGARTGTDELPSSERDWGFKFKGYFRAPMRVGIDNSGTLTPGKTQFHAPPIIPDGNYTRWMYTNISPGPWAELMFQYGNQQVMMTTSIASYNITSGGWRELQDQLGIDRAFLTLKFPEALGNLGGVAWDVGIFQNAYGAMGKYNAGQYETYLIGRTRIAGATATADMELGDRVKLVVEGGAGAKVDQQYQRYTTTTDSSGKTTTQVVTDYPSWAPYPGDKVQMGTTVLGHGHVGVVLDDTWTAMLHYIGAFARDARYNVGSQGGGNATVPGLTPDGSIQVIGADLKLDGGWMGEGYIGYSRLRAKNASVVSDAIEVLHSQGGWQLSHNFFADGNGNIDSIAGQYTFSLAAFLMRPRPFWGQATDLSLRVFGMWNRVSGTTAKGTDGVNIPVDTSANMSKLKYGAELTYSFSSMMAAALRADVVSPHLGDADQTFKVLTPKLIFRSEFVTHEAIVLQVSYYDYGAAYTDPMRSEAIMPWPFGTYGTLDSAKYGTDRSLIDKYVVTLYANMWW
jgi:hypothetical protein